MRFDSKSDIRKGELREGEIREGNSGGGLSMRATVALSHPPYSLLPLTSHDLYLLQRVDGMFLIMLLFFFSTLDKYMSI